MATRVVMRRIFSLSVSAVEEQEPWASSLIITRSKHLCNLQLFLIRWASSSSRTDQPSGNESKVSTSKPEKKLTDRLSAVIDAVNDRKLPPELRGQRNVVRSETDIINVVEQRIWQSMEEGQFENLSGKGKPLDLGTSPHADPAEDTLYRILAKNGCAPEWVGLNKEIRSNIAEWRLSLRRAHTNRSNGIESTWTEDSEALKSKLRSINDKVVDAYALIGDFAGLAPKMQSFSMQEVLSETHSVLRNIVEEIPESKFKKCLLRTLGILFQLLCSYYATMGFRPDKQVRGSDCQMLNGSRKS